MSNPNTRTTTNEILTLAEDGTISWEELAKACLNYMSEDDVEDMAERNDWNIWLEDEEDEEDDTIMKRFTASEKQKIDEISERYVTSSPISGKWETEAIHERDAIAKELRLTKEEANEVMIEYLGFDIEDLESEELTDKKVDKKITDQDVINAAKKYGLTFTREALRDLEWNVIDYINDSNFNSADEWMKAVIDGETEDISDMFEKDINWKKQFRESLTEEVCPDCGKEPDLENELLGKDYDKLNLYPELVLTGAVDLDYPSVDITDGIGNDIMAPVTIKVIITKEDLLDFICISNGLDRKELTVGTAQNYIDDIAKDLTDYVAYLREYFLDEASSKAQKNYARGL